MAGAEPALVAGHQSPEEARRAGGAADVAPADADGGADFAKLPRLDLELGASPLETEMVVSSPRAVGSGDDAGVSIAGTAAKVAEANQSGSNSPSKSTAAVTSSIDHSDSKATSNSRTGSSRPSLSRPLASSSSSPMSKEDGPVRAAEDDDDEDEDEDDEEDGDEGGVGDLEAGLGGAGSAKANDVLMAKINAFDEQRKEEKRRMFAAVLRLLHRLMALGFVGSCLGNVLGFLLPMDYVYDAVIAVSFGLILCGFVTATVCPVDVLDLDGLCRRNPKISVVAGFAAAGIALMHFPYFPHLELLKVISVIGICVAVWPCRPAWWPENTTFWCLYMVTDQVAWGSIYLFHERNQALLQLRRPVSLSLAGLHLLMGPVLLVMWRWRRARLLACRTLRSALCSPCIATYEVLYSWCIVTCVSTCTIGTSWILLPGPAYPDRTSGLIMLGRGLCIGMPALLVHRDGEDERYDDDDPRRKFQQGVVTEVFSASNFLVQLPPQEVLDSSAAEATGTRWPLSGLLAQTFAGGPVTRIQLPSTSESTSKEELLRRARQGLRCVDAWNLSQELMRRVNARNNPELQAQWYALSREVRPGEEIDFFLSNSWYDDAELKWQKLSEVIDKFHKRHGRFPTFWLDKVCIDQTSITDGLKVLAVNVMACRKLLVMCGHTYLSRLWCIWELFTLFAFASEEAALDRVEFVFLGDYDEGMAMLDNMVNFHVKNSHCYDPNEEARLRQVIDAVGTAPFNQRIADMGHITRLRLEHQHDGFRTGTLSWASKSWCESSSRSRTLANLASAEEAAMDLANL